MPLETRPLWTFTDPDVHPRSTDAKRSADLLPARMEAPTLDAAQTASAASRIVAFDLETTGRDPASDRIVEFAFITLDRNLEELDRWGELVDPGCPIPEGASEVHGITDEDVEGQRAFAYYAPLVQAMVDDAILMAYNHEFDKGFLHHELTRLGGHGLRERHPFIDPYWLFKQHGPDARRRLVDASQHYLGRDLDGAHRALDDTEAMVDVFRVQREVHGVGPSIEDALVPHLDWIDDDRKLYRDKAGIARFGFGKHEGEPIREHESYAEWMLGADFDEVTKDELRRVLGD